MLGGGLSTVEERIIGKPFKNELTMHNFKGGPSGRRAKRLFKVQGTLTPCHLSWMESRTKYHDTQLQRLSLPIRIFKTTSTCNLIRSKVGVLQTLDVEHSKHLFPFRKFLDDCSNTSPGKASNTDVQP